MFCDVFLWTTVHCSTHKEDTRKKINLSCIKSYFTLSGASRCCYRQMLNIIVCCYTVPLSNKQHHITHAVGWLPNYTNTTIQEATNTHNGHSGVFLTEQTWFTNKWKLQTELNLITSYYLVQFLRYKYATSVRRAPYKTRVVNCFPSFLITWITSSSGSLTPRRLNFFKCWQLSAIRRTVFPLNSC